MPRNEVVERVAKCDFDSKKIVKTTWDDLPEEEKELFREDAILQLQIVGSRTYGDTSIEGENIVVCDDELTEALAIAQAAEESGRYVTY